jgi:flagellar hook assembly protein FlgD
MLGLLGGAAVHADQGLSAAFYKDTSDQWGQFGSDPGYPKPYLTRVDPNIDFIFGNNANQHFSARWTGYLYVPPAKAGTIQFRVVSDDGARLTIAGNRIIDFWRLQSHQTIGTANDECTHQASLQLAEGYHPLTFEYFEWMGAEGDADPCKLYWDGQIIPPENFSTANSSGLEITDVSYSPNVIHIAQQDVCTINYTITTAANVTVTITSTDDNPIRTLLNHAAQAAGPHSVQWNGRTESGMPAADGVYLFVIEAENETDYAVYDPGVVTVPEVTEFYGETPFQPPSQTCPIHSTITADAMVRIRIGLANGPLLRTLVDWEPRAAGQHTDVWDGRDESGNVVPAGEYLVGIWADGWAANGILVIGPMGQ